TALAPAYTLVDTDDDGLCCGAGGAYALLQPRLAGSIRERKVAALRRAAPNPVVVSANPGCIVHLGQAGIDTRHPADLLADALDEGSGATTATSSSRNGSRRSRKSCATSLTTACASARVIPTARKGKPPTPTRSGSNRRAGRSREPSAP